MKKTYTLLMMALLSLSASAAGEDSNWGLYFYSETAGLNGDAGTFKTTDADGIFVLEGVSVTAEGVNFCVHNTDWSATYGWSDEGGSVDATDKAVKLAVSTTASGWLALAVGTYNVTWNANELTVTFKTASSANPSGANADWFVYLYSETAGLNGDAGQFKTTDTENVFVIDECNITAQGVGFCIHNAAWNASYGWSDEGGAVSAVGVACKLATSTTANGWLDLPAGTYKVTWNAADLTVRFDSSSATGIRNINNVEQIGATFSLAGQRVNPNFRGIMIKKGKKYVNR